VLFIGTQFSILVIGIMVKPTRSCRSNVLTALRGSFQVPSQKHWRVRGSRGVAAHAVNPAGLLPSRGTEGFEFEFCWDLWNKIPLMN
jgi:hypothetical protein